MRLSDNPSSGRERLRYETASQDSDTLFPFIRSQDQDLSRLRSLSRRLMIYLRIKKVRIIFQEFVLICEKPLKKMNMLNKNRVIFT